VPNLPKPMAPIKGRPFLEYLLDYWINQGVKKFILSVGYMSEVIVDHFGNNYKKAEISYSIENQPLGTGGALFLATKKITEPFLVINGDTFAEVNLRSLISFHLKKNSEWTFALHRVNKNNRYMGVNLLPNGNITDFNLSNKIDNQLINAGVYIMNPTALGALNLESKKNIFSLENDFISIFMKKNKKIYGLEYEGLFIDIGVPDDYLLANKIL
jgi:D-glycero-alpha-D-manno-heptose 1-phosphate guanylyltransferase